MTTPGRADGGPERPPGEPWDWAVDPPPPTGPTEEPPPDWSTPESPPPDWSTPQTPVTAPPLGTPATPPPWPPGAGRDAPGPAPGPPVGEEQPAPQPPSGRSTHPLWLILGIVAMLLSCCCVTTAVVGLTWGDEIYEEIRKQRERTVGLNQPARDGDLEFRVHQVRCGYDSVGAPFVHQNAMGQYCVAELTVRNLSEQPASFSDDLQRAYGPSGERFSADSGAGLLANGDRPDFPGPIEPGARSFGGVVYDIPRDSRIVRLRLHAAAGTRGVLVRTD